MNISLRAYKKIKCTKLLYQYSLSFFSAISGVLIILMFSTSCKDNNSCKAPSFARACIRNIGTDTIYGCFGCNLADTVVYPGDTVCAIATLYSTVMWGDTSGMAYGFEITDCITELEMK